jgi:hypothetical protein
VNFKKKKQQTNFSFIPSLSHPCHVCLLSLKKNPVHAHPYSCDVQLPGKEKSSTILMYSYGWKYPMRFFFHGHVSPLSLPLLICWRGYFS